MITASNRSIATSVVAVNAGWIGLSPRALLGSLSSLVSGTHRTSTAPLRWLSATSWRAVNLQIRRCMSPTATLPHDWAPRLVDEDQASQQESPDRR
jgi:hypothetical protein